MTTTSLTEALNPAQLEAVTYNDGPILVIAGAGAGKTRVLTYKIAYLLQQGVAPWNILALTFTNKAAKEMNERIADLCTDVNLRGLWSGTFHSLFARLLRMESEVGGWPADFTIYDALDSKSLVKAIVKELALDDKTYKPSTVAARISEAKNHLILSEAYAASPQIRERDRHDNIGELHRVYAIYQQRLRQAGAMDFDDLLVNTFYLLRDHDDVRQRYLQRFPYILVDEYQDTNMVQRRILEELTVPTSHICVVGDDAQSIYAFRGADISNILEFEKQYDNVRLVKLECNYRSTQNIVDAANSIIRHNRNQIPKRVYSPAEKGEPIEIFAADSDKAEAQKVVKRIVMHRRNGTEYNEIAVLYRTNAQSRVMEEALQGAGLPYRIYGGMSFYQRKEIKDVLAYLRLIVNPNDEEAFMRVVNYPARGIGQTTTNKLRVAAAANGTSIWNVCLQPAAYGVDLNRGACGKIEKFCGLIEEFRSKAQTETASQIAKGVILRSGINIDLAMDKSAESKARQENVEELVNAIASYEDEKRNEEGQKRVSIAEYLSTVSLLTDADTEDDGRPAVTLMTIHAAKGLEFDTVFVTGLEQELFPNSNALYNKAELEEERRLFYVAVTRAKRHCHLSYARSRYRFGSLQFGDESQFIAEIDEQYVEREQERVRDDFRASAFDDAPFRPFNSPRKSWRQGASEDGPSRYKKQEERPRATPRRVLPPAPPEGFKRAGTKSAQQKDSPRTETSCGDKTFAVGDRVRHYRFGEGVVTATEGVAASAKVRVRFEQAGEKNLLLKFAQLEKL